MNNKLSKREISQMLHATGCTIEGKYTGKEPWRNFYALNKRDELWDGLVDRGLATRRESMNQQIYSVSEDGLAALQEATRDIDIS